MTLGCRGAEAVFTPRYTARSGERICAERQKMNDEVLFRTYYSTPPLRTQQNFYFVAFAAFKDRGGIPSDFPLSRSSGRHKSAADPRYGTTKDTVQSCYDAVCAQ